MLVDGPHSGMIIILEGSPPKDIFMPAILYSKVAIVNLDEVPMPMQYRTHKYTGVHITRGLTVVYEYRGQV